MHLKWLAVQHACMTQLACRPRCRAELFQGRRMLPTAADVCREMACDSLRLLKAAVPGSFPREFLDERIWGCLIGMFELNNLSLQVQTPLELYFLACDDLPEPRRAEVQGQTSVWLDALDTEYDACVEVRSVCQPPQQLQTSWYTRRQYLSSPAPIHEIQSRGYSQYTSCVAGTTRSCPRVTAAS